MSGANVVTMLKNFYFCVIDVPTRKARVFVHRVFQTNFTLTGTASKLDCQPIASFSGWSIICEQDRRISGYPQGSLTKGDGTVQFTSLY
jgi:hypothetical protein